MYSTVIGDCAFAAAGLTKAQAIATLQSENIDLVALLWQTDYLTFNTLIDIVCKIRYKMKIPYL